ncbi:unnamed protein product [Nyctereutes procyonoides]|uniref:(raccoon dog) hypothetical protein n=1 Tax=Nyctereutes procyonoides TaxID=34880 RepID=A0A811YMI9_NYCPR|nr:unnamed protein product [Nyctereutes procyonoides]
MPSAASSKLVEVVFTECSTETDQRLCRYCIRHKLKVCGHPVSNKSALLFLSCKRTVLQAFCRHQRIPIRMSGVPGSTATDPPGDRGGLSQSPQNPGLRTVLTAAALLPAPPPTVPTLASLPLLLLCSRLPWPPVPRAEPPLPAQTYTWDKTSNVTRRRQDHQHEGQDEVPRAPAGLGELKLGRSPAATPPLPHTHGESCFFMLSVFGTSDLNSAIVNGKYFYC